jgi:hypothetical protein
MTATDKSYVSMEVHQCDVCAIAFETGAILLDRRLRPSMERTTLTGHGLCPACEAKHKEGYLALVVVANDPAERTPILRRDEARPAGEVIHIKREAAKRVFNVPEETINRRFIYIDAEAAAALKAMAEEAS